jgi:NADP-dependent 3-hydroxy acid dehydrogenase YdfG
VWEEAIVERLDGTVALVTGASSGIGAATAVALAQRGAAVALVARRRDRLEAVARRVLELGPPALCVEADVTDGGQVALAVEKTVARFGRLDTVVNNAGAMLVGPVDDAPVGEWERMVAVNQLGLLYVTQAAHSHVAKAAASDPRHVADVVNIGSSTGRVPRAGTAVYSMTKAGVVAFSESLRQEFRPQRIRVDLVEPGTVDPGRTPHAREQQRVDSDAYVRRIERLAPEDVARSVAFIVASPRHVAVIEIIVRAADQTW